jgi:hypothetical protein
MASKDYPVTAHANVIRVRNWFRKIYAGTQPPESFAKPRVKSGFLIFDGASYALTQKAIDMFILEDPSCEADADFDPNNPNESVWPFFTEHPNEPWIPGVSAEPIREVLIAPLGELKPRELQNVSIKTYARSEAVKYWVLARAKGSCESCSEPAPFLNESGEPYLEVHHIKQLAHGGSDRVSNTVALCPNCHRQFHFGIDKDALKEKMLAVITELQSE